MNIILFLFVLYKSNLLSSRRCGPAHLHFCQYLADCIQLRTGILINLVLVGKYLIHFIAQSLYLFSKFHITIWQWLCCQVTERDEGPHNLAIHIYGYF